MFFKYFISCLTLLLRDNNRKKRIKSEEGADEKKRRRAELTLEAGKKEAQMNENIETAGEAFQADKHFN